MQFSYTLEKIEDNQQLVDTIHNAVVPPRTFRTKQ